MKRKEFITKVGTTVLTLPICLGILDSCGQTDVVPNAPAGVDFTVDVSSGTLSKNGSYIVKNGIIIVRTNSGDFLALSAACTHEGATVQYVNSQNSFYCPRHGATFSSKGLVTGGPARQSLMKYNTSLSGASLRVFS